MPEREEMNGFDEATNQTVEIEGVVFQLPSYLTKAELTDADSWDLQYVYNDDQNGYAISFDTTNTTGEKFIAGRDGMLDKIIENVVNGKLRNKSDQNIGGMMARVFDMTAGDDNSAYAKGLLIYNYDTGKAIYVLAVESLSAPKTFAGDTDRIFFTAKKAAPEETPAETAPAAESIPAAEPAPENSDGVTPEFKQMMDEYEAFFNEYAEFMKNYANSDDAMSMMSDYLSMLSRYTEVMDKLDSIDESTLSEADDAYYTAVMLRINAKLIEAAEAMS